MPHSHRFYKSCRRSLLRAAALILIGASGAQEIANASPDLAASRALTAYQPDLPVLEGMVEDTYFDPFSERTLYLVQDAHVNESAQRNIASILRRLSEQRRVKYVFLEAGSGDDSLSGLRPLAGPARRRAVGDEFLRKGYIQGADYLDLTSDLDIRLWGVEDEKLYEQGVRLYGQLVSERADRIAYLDRLDAMIRSLEPEILGTQLSEIQGARRRFQSGGSAVTEYFGLLSRLSRKAGVPEAVFARLAELEELKAVEAQIDFELAARQQSEAVLSLDEESQKELARTVRRDLKDAPQRLVLHNEDLQVFYALLSKSVKDMRLYPELARYASYLEKAARMDIERLLHEREAVEAALFLRLCRTPDERRLISAARSVEMLRRLFTLTMTAEESAVLESDPDKADATQIAGYLNSKIVESGRRTESTLFVDPGFAAAYERAREFYRLTRERDRQFVERSIERMAAEGQSEAALVAGGYHASHLKQLLRSRRISYVSIVPRVLGKTHQRRYESLLIGQLDTSAGRSTEPVRALGVRPAAELVVRSGGASVPVLNRLAQALRQARGARLAGPADKEPGKDHAIKALIGRIGLHLKALLRDAAVWFGVPRDWVATGEEREVLRHARQALAASKTDYTGAIVTHAPATIPEGQLTGLGKAPLSLSPARKFIAESPFELKVGEQTVWIATERNAIFIPDRLMRPGDVILTQHSYSCSIVYGRIVMPNGEVVHMLSHQDPGTFARYTLQTLQKLMKEGLISSAVLQPFVYGNDLQAVQRQTAGFTSQVGHESVEIREPADKPYGAAVTVTRGEHRTWVHDWALKTQPSGDPVVDWSRSKGRLKLTVGTAAGARLAEEVRLNNQPYYLSLDSRDGPKKMELWENPGDKAMGMTPDLMLYAERLPDDFNAYGIRGIWIKPTLRGSGLMRPLLNLYFERYPDVQATHPKTANLLLIDLLYREYGFKPPEEVVPAVYRIGNEYVTDASGLRIFNSLANNAIKQAFPLRVVETEDLHELAKSTGARPVYLGQTLRRPPPAVGARLTRNRQLTPQAADNLRSRDAFFSLENDRYCQPVPWHVAQRLVYKIIKEPGQNVVRFYSKKDNADDKTYLEILRVDSSQLKVTFVLNGIKSTHQTFQVPVLSKDLKGTVRSLPLWDYPAAIRFIDHVLELPVLELPASGQARADAVFEMLKAQAHQHPELTKPLRQSQVVLGGFKLQISRIYAEGKYPLRIYMDRETDRRFVVIVDELDPTNRLVIEVLDGGSLSFLGDNPENKKSAGLQEEKFLLLQETQAGGVFYDRIIYKPADPLEPNTKGRLRTKFTKEIGMSVSLSPTRRYRWLTVAHSTQLDRRRSAQDYWPIPLVNTGHLEQLKNNVPTLEQARAQPDLWRVLPVLDHWPAPDYLGGLAEGKREYFFKVTTLTEDGDRFLLYRRIKREDRITSVLIQSDGSFFVEGVHVDNRPLRFSAGYLHLSKFLYLLTRTDPTLVDPPLRPCIPQSDEEFLAGGSAVLPSLLRRDQGAGWEVGVYLNFKLTRGLYKEFLKGYPASLRAGTEALDTRERVGAGARLATQSDPSERSESGVGNKLLRAYLLRLWRALGDGLVRLKLPLLWGGRTSIFTFYQTREGLVARAVRSDVRIEIKLEKGRRTDTTTEIAKSGQSHQDLQTREDDVHSRILAAVAGLPVRSDQAAVVELDTAFLDDRTYEHYAGHLLVSLRQARSSPHLANTLFVATGPFKERLLALKGATDLISAERPKGFENARTVLIAAAESSRTDRINLPMSKVAEGDVPAFVSIFELAAIAGRLDTNAVPDGFASAYATLAGERPDNAELQQILEGRSPRLARRYALKPLARVSLSTAIRYFELMKRVVKQAA